MIKKLLCYWPVPPFLANICIYKIYGFVKCKNKFSDISKYCILWGIMPERYGHI